MKYLRKFLESSNKSLQIEDVDQIDDLFLSVADTFKMVQVDYPTVNHVFSDEDEIIYRIHTLIDNHWDSEIESVLVRVVALGWFKSLPASKYEDFEDLHYHIPRDVMNVYGDLVKNLDAFRERLQKFDYHPLPIKCGADYYLEMVDGEEITTEGVSFIIQIKSKL